VCTKPKWEKGGAAVVRRRARVQRNPWASGVGTEGLGPAVAAQTCRSESKGGSGSRSQTVVGPATTIPSRPCKASEVSTTRLGFGETKRAITNTKMGNHARRARKGDDKLKATKA